ncbi:MAG: class I SAM-dependent methyltransferase [Maribacter sp.]
MKELVEQIEAKAKSTKKLSTWFSTSNIYYANKLNISQTSSELTANYKTGIVNGKTLLDVTGGFGVDSYAFSKKVKQIYHLEENNELSTIASHNFKQLEALNIEVICGNGLSFLSDSNINFDWIYLDPSRRTEKQEKVYFLSDCIPDVTKHLDLLFSKSSNLLIKAGPLLDLDAGIGQLKNIFEVHIVGVENEVKELLWVLKKGYSGPIQVRTVNLIKNLKQEFVFYNHEEKHAVSEYSLPENYLYEPNAPILKSGAYRLLGERYGLKKLNQHSHLYTSTRLIEFPGRRFKIDEVIPFSKKRLKSFEFDKANITVRNFPITVSEIRKKTQLKDGGEIYLFFTKNSSSQLIVIKCTKIH